MIPCKLCNPNNDGALAMKQKGLKQKGKTRRDGSVGERFYVCQDCGALWRTVFDTATKQVAEEPVFRLVKGGRA